MNVRAKKHLGQHFLTDENIARKIVDSLPLTPSDLVLEVGPGTGVLTKYLLESPAHVFLAEIDTESVAYLKQHYDALEESSFIGDFLKTDFSFASGKQVQVIGNFPYNISSQILFHVVDHVLKVPTVVGMFQKEVAERTASAPRTKSYGILSVLIQAYYDVEYLFTVHENVFNPPPKVKSGVIRLTRNIKPGLEGNEVLFKRIVKAGFGQRRKKLSNSLKVLGIPEPMQSHPFLDQRAEELSVADFIDFTLLWQESINS
ncbi:16S rRNA (adenine(1518)-N(6)/adenine(1519)-N(6))-dimethyltransferase RsmA [Planobacterium oryzisoli]|uniref:Ribosomal RNA small subunit methyltransferase A n=1 Tax=Planobacterium oryzisoli TaxID=2771435 RepID=A0A930YWK3_9FLAO|nr:16S rRNA (adenine(1518)-N(6)/adenine(1519)-N(6))-dimethyltransferase RsmA [Planobacterium oryzisoli]MBF5027611.1 16S rRNA (adenine(1518)-N(6)/adenine(1519)-N(6))-dimethyltransferase RsmA [Planobacterium oryzisoli]